MRFCGLALFLAACLMVVAPAPADQYVQTFDVADPMEAGWMYLQGFSSIEDTGGHPGSYLFGENAAYWPLAIGFPLAPGAPFEFSGDFRARQITSMGVDAIVEYVCYPTTSGPISLLLFNDNGTPADIVDDYAAVLRGADLPSMEDGWLSYDYDIPVEENTLPAEWTWWEYGTDAPETLEWDYLIQNVSYVGFMFGDPDLFGISQTWNIGIDNTRISWVPEPGALALLVLGAVCLRRR